MKRNSMKCTIKIALLTGAAVMAAAPVPAVAAPAATTVEISGTGSSITDAQSKVKLDKTDAVAPAFTVSVPATVALGRNSATLDYELKLNEKGDVLPIGKQVAVQIQSAGPTTELARSGDTFKVEGGVRSNWAEASYQIYDSDAAQTPHYYAIGEDLVVWNAGNHGIQQRQAKVLHYDSVEPDTYTGVINYTIMFRDAQ